MSSLRGKFKKHVVRVPHEDPDRGHVTKYRGNSFETHNDLPHHKTALYTFTNQQKIMMFLFVVSFGALFLANLTLALRVVLAILNFIYFTDFLLNLVLIKKNLKDQPEIKTPMDDILALKDEDLPVYSVLSPLYKESEILPSFVEAMSNMSWPKDKLDVLLLLEEDDLETIEVANNLDLPDYFRIVVVPNSNPKTKPKACNYGLKKVKGDYVTIYDAEDKPDIYQLKKAYLAFKNSPEKLVCVQGKLNYFNKDHNWLTKVFTAEYSLWFEIVLPSLQSINTMIPLGGTSNHFKVPVLKKLHGWDPFNVTEDCDLGVRLFKEGYTTGVIDSVTLEEANSNVHNWVRQRSRWIKGYLQTYFVHMRNPIKFFKEHKWHTILFQVVIGLRLSFLLINPFMWAVTVSYFVFYDYVGLFIESLFPPVIFMFAVTTMIFGNFFYVYNYMIGLAKHGHWNLIKYMYLIPVYWLLMSIAAVKAFKQLIFKPHYWEKTHHGLHFKKKTWFSSLGIIKKEDEQDLSMEPIEQNKSTENQPLDASDINFENNKNAEKGKSDEDSKLQGSIDTGNAGTKNLFAFNRSRTFVQNSVAPRMPSIMRTKSFWRGGFLVGSAFIANLANFLYNAYLGREVELSQFGTVSLISNVFAIASLFSSSLGKVTSYKTAFHYGQKGQIRKVFYYFVRKYTWLFSIVATLLWVFSAHEMAEFFNESNMVPFLLFTPYWLISFVGSVNSGFLSGAHRFEILGMGVVLESIAKVALAIIVIELGYPELIYTVIPISVFMSFLYEAYAVSRIKHNEPLVEANLRSSKVNKGNGDFESELSFPYKFYITSIFTKISSVIFLNADVILAKHFLNPVDAGRYAILSLAGKMVYFMGNLFNQFIIPVVSKEEGKSSDSKMAFYKILAGSTAMSFFGFIAIGVFGYITVPILFGDNAVSIVSFLPLYTLAMLVSSASASVVSYHQIKKQYSIAFITLFLALGEVFVMVIGDPGIEDFIHIISIFAFIQFFTISVYHLMYPKLKSLFDDIYDFVFGGRIGCEENNESLNILVFNWRDTKHVWAGGAEIYVHEIAKRWVGDGHSVTLFCGNDRKSSREETIDGVKIIRRGGFYTVYIWAALYYIFKFRKNCDVVVDSENGVPFFTPIFVSKPIILLIHHVHKDLVLNELRLPKYLLPVAYLVNTLESKIMPILYKKATVVTVSESTRGAVQDLGFKGDIQVITPGVELSKFTGYKKSKRPSILYLGRLKHYKSIDTLIKALQHIKRDFPDAELWVAGFGDADSYLRDVTSELELIDSVKFLGRVSEEDKVKLLGSAWVFAYASAMEGWGISIIEASASGTAVVAADVPGLRDSVKHNETGYLVTKKDEIAFAQAICDLIKNSETRDKLAQGGQTWAQNFTWESSANKFIESIFEMLEKKALEFKKIVILERKL